MKAIYEPKGKAREYGDYACNLYTGCGHGCSYCYAPNILRMDRDEFYNNPKPREGIIEALEKEAPKYKGKEVFLCFTTDPYQPINKKYRLTRKAIEVLHANDVAVNILTKGVITDFDILDKRPDLSRVGITYTGGQFVHENSSSPEWKRNRNLTRAKEQEGNVLSDIKPIKTWVSMEPIIHPGRCLTYIQQTHKIVDEFKLGKWNYDKRANAIDWHKFVNEAIELLEKLGCKYYIKEDLREYI